MHVQHSTREPNGACTNLMNESEHKSTLSPSQVRARRQVLYIFLLVFFFVRLLVVSLCTYNDVLVKQKRMIKLSGLQDFSLSIAGAITTEIRCCCRKIYDIRQCS